MKAHFLHFFSILAVSCLCTGLYAQHSTFVNASALDSKTVVLEFNQPLNASAENKENYSGLSILDARRGINNSQVILSLENDLELGIFYPILASNIKNLSGDLVPNEDFEVVFNNSLGELVITEILYNNPGPDTLEFIELTNNSGTDLQIGGWRFTDGIDFVFPTTTVAAGERIIVANYPYFDTFFGVPAQYWYTGGLSNTGERIELRNANSDIIDYLTYDDAFPWDTLPDGYGYTLTLCDVNSDNALPYSWQPSTFNDYVGNLTGFGGIYASPGGTSADCPAVVSVQEISSNSGFDFYPNPTTNSLNIELKKEGLSSHLNIQVHNIYGQLLINNNALNTNEIISLNVGELNSGIYVLSIRLEGEVYSRKFSVQK